MRAEVRVEAAQLERELHARRGRLRRDAAGMPRACAPRAPRARRSTARSSPAEGERGRHRQRVGPVGRQRPRHARLERSARPPGKARPLNSLRTSASVTFQPQLASNSASTRLRSARYRPARRRSRRSPAPWRRSRGRALLRGGAGRYLRRRRWRRRRWRSRQRRGRPGDCAASPHRRGRLAERGVRRDRDDHHHAGQAHRREVIVVPVDQLGQQARDAGERGRQDPGQLSPLP